MSAGKSFEDDDVELICSKSGLGPLQALTDALAATQSAQEQQSLLQVGLHPAQSLHAVTPQLAAFVLLWQQRHTACCMLQPAWCIHIQAEDHDFAVY